MWGGKTSLKVLTCFFSQKPFFYSFPRMRFAFRKGQRDICAEQAMYFPHRKSKNRTYTYLGLYFGVFWPRNCWSSEKNILSHFPDFSFIHVYSLFDFDVAFLLVHLRERGCGVLFGISLTWVCAVVLHNLERKLFDWNIFLSFLAKTDHWPYLYLKKVFPQFNLSSREIPKLFTFSFSQIRPF